MLERNLVGKLHHHVFGCQAVAGHGEASRLRAVGLLDPEQAGGDVLRSHPIVEALVRDAEAVRRRQSLCAHKARLAAVALEDNHPVADRKTRPGPGLGDGADALVTEVFGTVVPLELVIAKDAGLVAHGGDCVLDNDEALDGGGVGLLDHPGDVWFGDGQDGVGALGHFGLPFAGQLRLI